MFETRVAIGERVAVWSPPSVEPVPRLRVLLPGQGASAREQAMTAVFVPSMEHTGRKTAKTGSRAVRGPGRRDDRFSRGGAGRRRVVLPGDPTKIDAAFTRWRGFPGAARTETGRALRLNLIDGVSEVGAAVMELGCWRTRIGSLPPGPELVTALTERPDALAPAPITNPSEALATAWAARSANVGDRVATGWANAVLESVTARARVLAWLQAEQYTDLAMLSRNYPGLAEMLPTEVGFALRTSDSIAGNAISTARTMVTRLPGTLEALRAGLIDSGHAMGLASATSTTTARVAAAVEADLLPLVTAKGSTITAEQLRRRAVRRVIVHDPDGAADRHRKARTGRTMTRWAEEDGMAGLKVLAPAEQIAAIWEAVTGLADAAKTPWDPRSLGARRVDCLSGVCLDILTGMTPAPTAGTPAGKDAPGPEQTGQAQPTPTPGTPAGQGAHAPAQPAPAQPAPAQPASAEPAAAHPVSVANTTTSDDAPATARSCPARPGSAEPTAGETPVDENEPGPAKPRPAAPAPFPEPAITDPDTGADAGADADADADAASDSDTAISAAVINAADDERPAPGGRPELTRRHGRRPHIQVLVPYQVLLGSDDPCELAGHGAITADQARTIIKDGTLQRLLYDPASGTVLDYGRTRYEPPETLKQFITARDRTCRTPGCLQPAERCQIDHVEPFHPDQPVGGHTSHTNLDGKCQHHHRAKDGGGFLNTRDPDGTTHWTTPLGRNYTMPPPQVIEPAENYYTANTCTAHYRAENNCDTDDLDDQFPPELRKTTDFFLQSRHESPGSAPQSARSLSDEPKLNDATNSNDSAGSTDPGQCEEEPPF